MVYVKVDTNEKGEPAYKDALAEAQKGKGKLLKVRTRRVRKIGVKPNQYNQRTDRVLLRRIFVFE